MSSAKWRPFRLGLNGLILLMWWCNFSSGSPVVTNQVGPDYPITELESSSTKVVEAIAWKSHLDTWKTLHNLEEILFT